MYGLVALADVLVFIVGLYSMYIVLHYPRVQPAFAPAYRMSVVEIKTPLFVASFARRKEWYHDS